MRRTCIWRGMTFNKYEIDSKTGNIYRRGSSSPLKPWDDQRGYLVVTLIDDNGLQYNCKVHVVSAHTFLGPQPDNTIIEHNDGNKYHNWPSNLEYTSQRENVARAQVKIKGKVYLDSRTVQEIRARVKETGSIAQTSREFDLEYWIVRDIISGKTYTHFD